MVWRGGRSSKAVPSEERGFSGDRCRHGRNFPFFAHAPRRVMAALPGGAGRRSTFPGAADGRWSSDERRERPGRDPLGRCSRRKTGSRYVDRVPTTSRDVRCEADAAGHRKPSTHGDQLVGSRRNAVGTPLEPTSNGRRHPGPARRERLTAESRGSLVGTGGTSRPHSATPSRNTPWLPSPSVRESVRGSAPSPHGRPAGARLIPSGLAPKVT